MKAYTESGIFFAELSPAQEAFCEGMSFDDVIVTSKEMKLVRKAFELDGMSKMEAQAVRNAVVKFLADLGSKYREMDAMDSFFQTRANMSAITATIDLYMFNMQGEL